jgi:hypothetical protein
MDAKGFPRKKKLKGRSFSKAISTHPPIDSTDQCTQASSAPVGRSWDLHTLTVVSFGFILAAGVQDWKIGASLLGGYAALASLRTVFRSLKFILLVTLVVSVSILFPVLAPVTAVITVWLLLRRLNFLVENWSIIWRGTLVYALPVALWIWHREIKVIDDFSLGQNAVDPQVLRLGIYFAIGTLTMHLFLIYAYHKGYSTARTLEIISIIPLLLASLVLVFLKISFHSAPDFHDGVHPGPEPIHPELGHPGAAIGGVGTLRGLTHPMHPPMPQGFEHSGDVHPEFEVHSALSDNATAPTGHAEVSFHSHPGEPTGQFDMPSPQSIGSGHGYHLSEVPHQDMAWANSPDGLELFRYHVNGNHVSISDSVGNLQGKIVPSGESHLVLDQLGKMHFQVRAGTPGLQYVQNDIGITQFQLRTIGDRTILEDALGQQVYVAQHVGQQIHIHDASGNALRTISPARIDGVGMFMNLPKGPSIDVSDSF